MMAEHVAYQIFLGVVFGALGLLTVLLIVVAVLLIRRNRKQSRRSPRA